MDAESGSQSEFPQSRGKHPDFIILQRSVFEKWTMAKRNHDKKCKDSEFAEFLLENLEQNQSSNSSGSANTTFARGTQTVPIPKDLHKELESISLTLQFNSIVRTIRHLVDLFHEKYPNIKLMKGMPSTKRPRMSASAAPPSSGSNIDLHLSQGIIPGELLQPVEENDSVSFLIKNVLQTIESENKQSSHKQSIPSSTPPVVVSPESAALAAAMSPQAAIAQGIAPPLAPLPRANTGPAKLDPSYIQKGHIHECTYCRKILKSQDEIQNHVFTTHGIEPFFCRLCQACTSIEEDMVQHVSTNHECIYLCGFDKCNYSAARKGSINGHYVATHCKGTVFSTIQVRKGQMRDMYVNRRETCFGLRKTRVVQLKQ